MTDGIWKCSKCNFNMRSPIYKFIPKCPGCGQKYRYLADIVGYHIVHSMPFSVMEGGDFEDATTLQPLVFASGGGDTTFECRDEEFFEWFKKQERSPHIKVVMRQE